MPEPPEGAVGVAEPEPQPDERRQQRRHAER